MSHCKLHDVASQLRKKLKWLLISPTRSVNMSSVTMEAELERN